MFVFPHISAAGQFITTPFGTAIENPAFKVQTFGEAAVQQGIASARSAELACYVSAEVTCTVFSTLTKNLLWGLFFGAKVA